MRNIFLRYTGKKWSDLHHESGILSYSTHLRKFLPRSSRILTADNFFEIAKFAASLARDSTFESSKSSIILTRFLL